MKKKNSYTNFQNQIFTINNSEEFDSITLQIFHHQSENCAVYKEYIQWGIKNNKFPEDFVKCLNRIKLLNYGNYISFPVNY